MHLNFTFCTIVNAKSQSRARFDYECMVNGVVFIFEHLQLNSAISAECFRQILLDSHVALVVCCRKVKIMRQKIASHRNPNSTTLVVIYTTLHFQGQNVGILLRIVDIFKKKFRFWQILQIWQICNRVALVRFWSFSSLSFLFRLKLRKRHFLQRVGWRQFSKNNYQYSFGTFAIELL